MKRVNATEETMLMEAPPEPRQLYPQATQGVDGLAIIRGSTFFAATSKGDITPPGAPQVGLFSDDTRFLSRYELLVNGREPSVLSSTTMGADMARVELTAGGGPVTATATGDTLDLPINTVYVHREQLLDLHRLYDVLEIQNFYDAEVTLSIEIGFAADFMDIFQVRGLIRGKHGRYYQPLVTDTGVRLRYEGLDERTRVTELEFTPRPEKVDGDSVQWSLRLPPRGKDRIMIAISMDVRRTGDPQGVVNGADEKLEAARALSVEQHTEWLTQCTRWESDNRIFDAMLDTSAEDFYALRMPTEEGAAVAAGVPWFAALFGRDSLLSSYEALLLNPDLARATLRVLANYQGTTGNDERDEDPGKILHERRSGEMTATNEVAFGRCYGSVDATPLFLILAHEYFLWTGDRGLLHEIKKAIEAAVRWILEYGDLDDDGLIEYCRRSPKGLFNQGWKDSGDANRHSDGSIAEPPVALVEVQGYAVRALDGASRILELLGDERLAQDSREGSARLRRLIEERFWQEDRGSFAMALDRRKEPLRVDGSNPGHLLFSAAIDVERAQQVAERLLEPGLFCGWGIRTLACTEDAYNPMSYHCGSVWPHDNAVIGYGMARYGMHREASTVFQALYDAALYFREYRLPELFCGIQRQPRSEPVHYPVSCSPQAWAAGAPFLLLTGLLGLRPDADAGELLIADPHLPPFIGRLRLENLRIGRSRISLEFKRDGERTHCHVIAVTGEPIQVSVVFATKTFQLA